MRLGPEPLPHIQLRKLEYILPDAIASNADTLVSIGGVQSNHTRIPEGSKVLCAHLGGAPALNGYAYAFRNG
jgi:1-aminocyclopropane-1-carboxylate deaminase/D-cysteine desulfhydrase-like pyridoxal-dependent ACC family enzyme